MHGEAFERCQNLGQAVGNRLVPRLNERDQPFCPPGANRRQASSERHSERRVAVEQHRVAVGSRRVVGSLRVNMGRNALSFGFGDRLLFGQVAVGG